LHVMDNTRIFVKVSICLPNLVAQIVLESMKRGYTREWYLNRIEAINRINRIAPSLQI